MKRLLAIAVLFAMVGVAEAGPRARASMGWYAPTYTYYGKSFSNSTTYTPNGVIQTYQPYNRYLPAQSYYWGW